MSSALSALGITDLPLFIAAALLLNITPGPDLLFVLGRASGARRMLDRLLGLLFIGLALRLALQRV